MRCHDERENRPFAVMFVVALRSISPETSTAIIGPRASAAMTSTGKIVHHAAIRQQMAPSRYRAAECREQRRLRATLATTARNGAHNHARWSGPTRRRNRVSANLQSAFRRNVSCSSAVTFAPRNSAIRGSVKSERGGWRQTSPAPVRSALQGSHSIATPAAIIPPMLVPATQSNGTPASRRAFSTPIWAKPRAPPPASTMFTAEPAMNRASRLCPRCCQSAHDGGRRTGRCGIRYAAEARPATCPLEWTSSNSGVAVSSRWKKRRSKGCSGRASSARAISMIRSACRRQRLVQAAVRLIAMIEDDVVFGFEAIEPFGRLAARRGHPARPPSRPS